MTMKEIKYPYEPLFILWLKIKYSCEHLRKKQNDLVTLIKMMTIR